MKVSLRCSGGLSGFTIAGTLETADLPADVAERVQTLLRPGKLTEKRREPCPHADLREYIVGLFTAAGYEEYRIEEGVAPTEILELMDELVAEVVNRGRSTEDN